MLTSYADITKRLGEPQWWDEYGVPRYCRFHPKHCGVYIRRAVFVVIECQHCLEEFKAAYAESLHEEEYQSGEVPHYGDPPNHRCTGDSMNISTIRVLQVWYQPDLDWERDRDAEVKMNASLRGEEAPDASPAP